MNCGKCTLHSDFQTSCGHWICFQCFSTYIKTRPKYPIQCLCCFTKLTAEECIKNIFNEDIQLFMEIKNKFKNLPQKRVVLYCKSVKVQSLTKTKEENNKVLINSVSCIPLPIQQNIPRKDLFFKNESNIKDNIQNHVNQVYRDIKTDLDNDVEIVELCNSINADMKSQNISKSFNKTENTRKQKRVSTSVLKCPVSEKKVCVECLEKHSLKQTCQQWRDISKGIIERRKNEKKENDTDMDNNVEIVELCNSINAEMKSQNISKSFNKTEITRKQKRVSTSVLKCPAPEKKICVDCQEKHSAKQTCQQWRDISRRIIERRNRIKKENDLIDYAHFMNIFGRCNNEDVKALCKSKGWFHVERKCYKCNSNKSMVERTRKGYHIWTCKTCSSSKSFKSNTWFGNSSMGLFEILQLTFCWVLDVNQCTTMQLTGKSRDTVGQWFRKCRFHIIDIIEKCATMIGGPDIHVEIDEVLLGKPRLRKGIRLPQQRYLGMIEHENKKSLMVIPIVNCNQDTLENTIKTWILPDSIIHTDGLSGFDNLQQLGFHHVINTDHSKYRNDLTPKSSYWNYVTSFCQQKGLRRKYMTYFIMDKIWRQRNESLSTMEKFEQFMSSTLNCYCTQINFKKLEV